MNCPELIKKISELTKIDPIKIETRAYYLRQTGLLKKEGRGLNAAEMGASDVINLILSLGAGKPARNVGKKVSQYCRLADLKGRCLSKLLESELSCNSKILKVSIRINPNIQAQVALQDGTTVYFYNPAERVRMPSCYCEEFGFSGSLLRCLADEI